MLSDNLSVAQNSSLHNPSFHVGDINSTRLYVAEPSKAYEVNTLECGQLNSYQVTYVGALKTSRTSLQLMWNSGQVQKGLKNQGLLLRTGLLMHFNNVVTGYTGETSFTKLRETQNLNGFNKTCYFLSNIKNYRDQNNNAFFSKSMKRSRTPDVGLQTTWVPHSFQLQSLVLMRSFPSHWREAGLQMWRCR